MKRIAILSAGGDTPVVNATINTDVNKRIRFLGGEV